MEADLGLWLRWRRLQLRAELVIDFSQSRIMDEQGFVNLGQAFEDGGTGGVLLPHLDKSTDDVNAHGDRARAVEHVGGHKGAMFGESDRWEPRVAHPEGQLRGSFRHY